MRKAKVGILFDIDGVLWKKPDVFPFTLNTMKKVIHHNIPYLYVTNGGGSPDNIKCLDYSQRLGLTIDESQIILSHTPLKSLLQDFKDRLFLVSGSGDPVGIAKYYGLNRVVNTADVISAYPNTWPFKSIHKEKGYDGSCEFVRNYDPSNVEGIAVLNDGQCWGSEFQVIVDALIFGKKGDNMDHPPIFFSNADRVWKTSHEHSRFAQGMYNSCIKNCYKQMTNKDITPIQCGKPTLLTFNYAKERLLMKAKEMGYDDINEYYMIGDNPESDIRGANNIGWKSVLLRSGVYDGIMNSENPTTIQDNVSNAIDWIFKEHNI